MARPTSTTFVCPDCATAVIENDHGIACTICTRDFVAVEGILDFGSGHQWRPATRLGRDQWHKAIRNHMNATGDGDRTLYEACVPGRIAWKFLLHLTPEARVLDLGCGTGLATESIAPSVSQVIAADIAGPHLELARDRFRLFNADNDILVVAISGSGAPPFATHAFDCILLSSHVRISRDGWLTVRHGRLSHRLCEVSHLGRMLAEGGELFWVADNAWSHELPTDTGLSYFGYRRALRRVGFTNIDFFALLRRRAFLHEIRPLGGFQDDWTPARAPSWKDRVKLHKFFVPQYGIRSKRQRATHSTALGDLLEHVRERLAREHGLSGLRMSDFRISRKEKAVLRIRSAATDLFLRLPLTEAALASEERNSSVLQSMPHRATGSTVFPRTILTGRHRRQDYFVENQVPGTPLSRVVAKEGSSATFAQVSSLLDRLNPNGGTEYLASLEGERFEREVTEKLSVLETAIDDKTRRRRLRSYFSAHLHGSRLPFGLLHGDFSLSNILADEGGRITGLIDWEGASRSGIVVLDAIHYVESLHRFRTRKHVGIVIPKLAACHFESEKEEHFLSTEYARFGVDPALHEPLVYLKWLRHMAYLLRFWLRYDYEAQHSFVAPVVDAITEP